MCNKNAPPKLKNKSRLIDKEPTVSLNNPSRKTRTKTRKPKFLSLLRLDSSPETSDMTHHHHHHHHQLNLFPLHPENLVEQEKDQFHDENMAYLFSSSDTNATTLTSLLEYSENNEQQQFTRISSEEDSISPSLTYAYRGQNSEMEGVSCSLVKTALRNKERDASEEKWVSYSEVVEEKQKEEEVTSYAADVRDHKSLMMIRQQRLLSLKLDYQEILNAWSDKGPLYIIEGDQCPQTVPDLHDDHFPPHDCANVLMDGWGGAVGYAGLWRVPEKSKKKMEEEMNGGEGDVGWKIGQREASVLRYKEKRQSRLFAKRIRYEVRKLNAEKRPRMKGRFVRRS